MTTIYTKQNFLDYIKNNTLNNHKEDSFYQLLEEVKLLINNKKNNKRTLPKFKKINLTLEEKYNNEINILLNKLSPKIYEKISEKIFDYYKSNIDDIINLLDITINNLFNKAVFQPIYCPIYVKLITEINELYDIKNLLVEKCKQYKNMILKENKKDKSNMTEQEKYDVFCDNNKLKVFKEGYSQFISELCNNKIITIEIIYDYLNFFVESINNLIDSEHIESIIVSIYKLLTNCKEINIFKKKNIQEKLKLIEKNKLPKRLQFKILDILEL